VTFFLDSTLGRRLDEALTKEGAAYVEAWDRVLPGSGAESLWVGGGCILFTGADSPVTQAIGLGREGPVSAADLDAVEHFFAERGAVPRINLFPFAHPSLVEELGRRSYRVEEFENALARPLSSGDSFDIPAAGIEVREVGGTEFDRWAAVVARGFKSAPRESVPTEGELALARVSPFISGVKSYVASIDGEFVAGGSVSVHDGIATMFGDATLPEWRRRGAQTVLLKARLDHALQEGCDLAAAGASPGSGSQRNMEKLGFRVAYTQIMMVRGDTRWLHVPRTRANIPPRVSSQHVYEGPDAEGDE
jgi:GNAT superfamily N-acetyltransferase